MPQPRLNHGANSFYHLFNRGNRKQQIFFTQDDYSRFLEKIEEYRQKYSYDIIAFCLLPNHFHLLVKQMSQVPTSKFVGVLLNSHSHYMSAKHEMPPGHLFQGRFGQTLIENEPSLLQATRYIHLNAIKEQLLRVDFTSRKKKSLQRNKNLRESLRNYRWSSYPIYLSHKTSNGIISINPQPIWELEKTPRRYQKFVESKISDADFLNLEELGL